MISHPHYHLHSDGEGKPLVTIGWSEAGKHSEIQINGAWAAELTDRLMKADHEHSVLILEAAIAEWRAK